MGTPPFRYLIGIDKVLIGAHALPRGFSTWLNTTVSSRVLSGKCPPKEA
jgi:hypothetical protein